MAVTEKVSPRYGKIMKFLGGALGEVTVGVHSAEGGATHSEGQSIAQIAETHEFGLGKIPQRSFIRAWFDENEDEIKRVLTSQLELGLKQGRGLDWSLERVALWAQASIQKRITQGIPPALHPYTIAKKGSSVPLIDTGILRSAILARYKVLS